MASDRGGGGGRPRDVPLHGTGRAAAVGWAGAGALYVLAYAGAMRLSIPMGNVVALLVGLANAGPDLLAAPLVVAAARRAGDGTRALRRLAPAAVGFVVFSVLASAVLLATVRWGIDGPWRFTLDARGVAWKSLISGLVFAVLAAVGLASEASLRARRAETLRAESRLAVLRAQLNPHFILNVLHSLVGLAERDPAATAGALERLGTSLRYALRVQSRGSDRVLLRDELAFVRELLELERLRLGDRLDARLDVDEGALSAVVPPFVLQPLVENAIRHAIAPRAAGGIVAVGVAREDGALVLTVDDDGPGPERSGPPAGAPPAAVPTEGNGIGLALLSDRLAALYGGGATLEVGRSPLGGTRSRVRLAGEPRVFEEGEGG